MARESMSSEYGPGKPDADARVCLPLPTLVDGEPRIRDLDLAARLGFAQERDIRKLIARHRGALSSFGPMVERQELVGKGQRVTTAYLNRKQAIFITAKSDTVAAIEITIEIVERFEAYEKGLFARPTVSKMNTAALNAASRAIGEVRRSLGARVAAEALPDIFARAGISIPIQRPDQGELDLSESPNVVNLRSEAIPSE